MPSLRDRYDGMEGEGADDVLGLPKETTEALTSWSCPSSQEVPRHQP
jgi:hypothetical protein